MSVVTVTTQAELDQALADGAAEIRIDSPDGVWLDLRETGSSHVTARGSAHVTARGSAHVTARGSSRVDASGSARVTASGSARVTALGSARVDAWDSSYVTAWDSAHVTARGSSRVDARGSSHVTARGSARVTASGSARVTARGSAHVTAWDSAHVTARGSSHVTASGSAHVTAGKYVAVHLHSQSVTLSGGVVIDMTAIDHTDPLVWCEMQGVPIVDGKATLFKALDDDLRSGHVYRSTVWPIGETVTCDDWRADNSCGGGLHLSPTTATATAYRPDAARWVRVQVDVATMHPIDDGGAPKVKVPSALVVAEVDRHGNDIEAA